MKTYRSTIEPLESRIAPATFIVNTINDTSDAPNNAGHIVSLRDALALADAQGGANTILFHLPASQMVDGAFTIALSSLGTLTSKGDVTIAGPGAGKLIIDGGNKYGVFDFNSGHSTGPSATDSPVTISGMSIVFGSSSSGGAIYSAESLTLNSVVISGNSSTGSNGGIYVSGDAVAKTAVVISHSLITDNTAADYSGGMGLARLKSFTMTDTVVDGNTATSDGGGGIAVDLTSHGTGIRITDCQIFGNTASFGGGLKVEDLNTAATSKIIIRGTTISGNTATGASASGGGGMYVGQGSTVITGSTIKNNTAVYDGGGIAAQGFASLTISSSNLTDNQTTKTNATNQGGGGVFIEGNGSGTLLAVKITGSHITDNRSAYDGGGVYAFNGVALTISGSTFSGDNAAAQGGGVCSSGFFGKSGDAASRVDLTVTGGIFSDNFAGQAGGGIFGNEAFGSVSITGSKVTGNISVDGGGIFATSLDPTIGVTLKNVVATGNFAFNYGGGLAIEATPVFHVSGGSFTGNGAQFVGGGIFVNDATGSIEGATISGNTAGVSGGGVYHIFGGTVTLQIADVTANSAPSDPNTHGAFTPFL